MMAVCQRDLFNGDRTKKKKKKQIQFENAKQKQILYYKNVCYLKHFGVLQI